MFYELQLIFILYNTLIVSIFVSTQNCSCYIPSGPDWRKENFDIAYRFRKYVKKFCYSFKLKTFDFVMTKSNFKTADLKSLYYYLTKLRICKWYEEVRNLKYKQVEKLKIVKLNQNGLV